MAPPLTVQSEALKRTYTKLLLAETRSPQPSLFRSPTANTDDAAIDGCTVVNAPAPSLLVSASTMLPMTTRSVRESLLSSPGARRLGDERPADEGMS